MIKSILIQDDYYGSEARSVKHAIAIGDRDKVPMPYHSTIDELETLYKQSLIDRTAMPVGSVEFCRRAMQIANIQEPDINPYPKELSKFYNRKINTCYKYELGSVNLANTFGESYFIKPVVVKQFNGFVYKPDGKYNVDDQEQLDIVDALPICTQLYISEKIDLVCEYRYYIQDKTIIGSARYDWYGSDDIVDVPYEFVVEQAIDLLGIDHPYVLDFGITDSGNTVLVEYNDAWAIGYYKDSMKSTDYLNFLTTRWESLRSK